MRSLIRPAMLSGAGALAAILAGSAANAAVTISTAATANMNCVSGVCTPTATNAVLNVGDLTTMLASGNVKLAAAGEPVDVDIAAPLSWVSTNTLTLDSYHSINVQQPVAITGGGGLAIITNDGGTDGEFAFAPATNVAIWSPSSSLTINGTAYTLVDDIATLASDVTANPSGSYALAGNYNAGPDGAYSASPIATTFAGNFQGLGNAVSNLAITNKQRSADLGLFALAEAGATISNVNLLNAAVTSLEQGSLVGGLVGENLGVLLDDHISGSITGAKGSLIGGLNGANLGSVVASSSSATATGGYRSFIGSLIGEDSMGSVSLCFATGTSTGTSGEGSIGGLVGYDNAGTISDSYAEGAVSGTDNIYSNAGGLTGAFQGTTISTSYSIGQVTDHKAAQVGGFAGYYVGGTGTDDYWDKTTSGQDKASGNERELSGVKSITTAKLQKHLPAGFDPTIWAQSPSINSGFPYLIANPPQ